MLLPDVGEGVAEAEIVEWNVKVGDTILEDEVVGAVMTDKAAVEIPSSVTGKVTWLAGDVGDVIAVGADLVRLEVDGDGNQKDDVARDTQQAPVEQKAALAAREVSANITDAGVTQPTPPAAKVNASGAKPLAAPSVRKRVKDAGADLSAIPGTGPAGRITHDDVDLWLEQSASTQRTGKAQNTMIKEIKVIGMRRKIAEQMSLAKSRIPHITIVEEVDVTNLEELRAELNTTYADTRAKLTVLPFVMKAIVEAAREIPEINSIYDDEKNIVYQHGGVHIGIATQTDAGLMVPVVKHCEARSLWESAERVLQLASQCREGSVVRDDLSGSTITVTSLGPLGALATTPIINHPEVAIIGINKMAVRPMWDGQQFMPRTMMNISASFDHRIVDGWQAALTVQKLKTLLEKPAMLFVED
jgi:2-oxoisovalerate dehydrogenase E2 component (dihydrolipoyl transacylase)